MSYTVANMLRATDLSAFVEIFDRVARPELEAGGCNKIQDSQTIYGGEYAGAITMAADFDSVTAATSTQVAANTKEAGPEAREAGVTLVSRSLVINREHQTDGEFGSLMQVTGCYRGVLSKRGPLLVSYECRGQWTTFRCFLRSW